jgi:hypothetical protein
VDAATKFGLLELIDEAVEAGWPLRRACRLLDLNETRAWRWMDRRRRDELDDKAPGGNPSHGLLDDEVLRSWPCSTTGARLTGRIESSRTAVPT